MKLDYHLSLCYPADMAVAAREMDRLLWSMVERAAGLSIPNLEEGRGVECVLTVPIARQTGRSYQDCLVRTPVRHGGLGMRSMADVSLLGFMGGLEQSMPRFV